MEIDARAHTAQTSVPASRAWLAWWLDEQTDACPHGHNRAAGVLQVAALPVAHAYALPPSPHQQALTPPRVRAGWFFEGVLATQFHGDRTVICNPQGQPARSGLAARFDLCTADGGGGLRHVTGVQVTAEKYVLEDFLEGYKYENRWLDMGVLVAWIAGIRLGAYPLCLAVHWLTELTRARVSAPAPAALSIVQGMVSYDRR